MFLLRDSALRHPAVRWVGSPRTSAHAWASGIRQAEKTDTPLLMQNPPAFSAANSRMNPHAPGIDALAPAAGDAGSSREPPRAGVGCLAGQGVRSPCCHRHPGSRRQSSLPGGVPRAMCSAATVTHLRTEDFDEQGCSAKAAEPPRPAAGAPRPSPRAWPLARRALRRRCSGRTIGTDGEAQGEPGGLNGNDGISGALRQIRSSGSGGEVWRAGRETGPARVKPVGGSPSTLPSQSANME